MWLISADGFLKLSLNHAKADISDLSADDHQRWCISADTSVLNSISGNKFVSGDQRWLSVLIALRASTDTSCWSALMISGKWSVLMISADDKRWSALVSADQRWLTHESTELVMNYATFATFARWVRVRVSVTNSVVYSTNANVSALTISAVSADHQRCQRWPSALTISADHRWRTYNRW